MRTKQNLEKHLADCGRSPTQAKLAAIVAERGEPVEIQGRKWLQYVGKDQQLAIEIGVTHKALPRAAEVLARKGWFARVALKSVGTRYFLDVQAALSEPTVVDTLSDQLAGRQKANGAATSLRSNGTTPSNGPRPTWDASTGELRLGDNEWQVAEQAKRIREALTAFEEAEWKQWITSPCGGNPQAHKDVIRALNRCSFLSFRSVQRGTSIAWQHAK